MSSGEFVIDFAWKPCNRSFESVLEGYCHCSIASSKDREEHMKENRSINLLSGVTDDLIFDTCGTSDQGADVLLKPLLNERIGKSVLPGGLDILKE